ncbi:PA26 p53-induced protein (sestrin), putative [Angomonas deanei]|uniref:PA26 p53-induced protein (Sestrin), putative n=1 Tax=Angomonas deanei TaxID=59799 RepID=A0A7G2CVE5_9TRYP|nr:PA26 p53-induced protein (sestrin), putative [Angomonas deanei]
MAAARHRCEYLVSRFSALLERYLSQIGEGPEEDGGATYGAQDRREAEVEETGSQSCSDDDLFNSSPVLNSLTGGPSHGGSNHQSRGVSQQRYFNSSATQLSNTNNNYLSANTSYVASIDDVPKRFWLSNGPPARLRHVREFIAHAVHTPWVVSEDEVKDILRTGWTVPELFQLVALLAEVIPITSYVAGLFVPTEPWTSVVLSPAWTNAMPHVATAEDLTLTNAVVPVVSAAPPPQKPSRVTSRTTLDAVCLAPASPEEEQLLTATPTMLARHYSGGRGAAPEEVPWSKASDVFLRYTGEDDIYSTQRIRSRDTLRTLWRRQFSWSEIGALHMEQYYPSAARYLSEELERYNDTVRTLQEGVCVGLRGRSDITPSYTLHSLSTYIQNLMGFMIEDYPYNDINKILRRPSKWLAQVLTLRPETLSRVDVMSWFTSPYNNNNNNNTNSGRQNSEGANNNTNTNNNPAGETFQSHQLRREIELLAEVKPNFFNKNPVVPLSGATSSGGGSTPHNGSLSQPPPASLTPNHKTTSLLTPAAEEPDNNNNNKELENMTEMVSGALSMQDEHIILWIALTTMEARKEGLLHLLLHPLYMTLNNM